MIQLFVYLYYLYRTYILKYYHYLMYKYYNNYKLYYILVVSQDGTNCILLELDDKTYTFYNSKIFSSFIIIEHNVYLDEKYLKYYEIVTTKYDSYNEFMNIHNKYLEVSEYKFISAELKLDDKSYIIPIEQFMVVSNTLFFKEFNMWLITYFFKLKYTSNYSIHLIDNNVNMLNNQQITILNNDYI